MAATDYPIADLSAWHQTGEGGNGKTYENPQEPDLLLKVNNPPMNSLQAIQHEFDIAKAVGRLGVPTPGMREIVRVGNGYAIIAERIRGKRSLGRICHDEPQRTEEMARILCEKGRQMFATPCDTEFFPSRKAQLMKALESFRFISGKNRAMIRAFAESIPDATTCIHGDFQMGNLIKTGEQFYWIDLDRFAYGDPLFDIGHLFQLCKYYSSMKRVRVLFHMEEEQFHLFWDAFAKAYTGKDDHSEFDRMAGRFACLDVIVRTVLTKSSIAEQLFFGMFVRRFAKLYF